jgi:Rod binding domain-containing protein
MQTRQVNSGTNVNAANQVSQSVNGKDAELKSAQFAEVLLNQMLDSMQETALKDAVSDDGSSNISSDDMLASMLDQQYVTPLAEQSSSPDGLDGISSQLMSGNPPTPAAQSSAMLQNLQYYLESGMLPTSIAAGAPMVDEGSSNQRFTSE